MVVPRFFPAGQEMGSAHTHQCPLARSQSAVEMYADVRDSDDSQ